MGWGDIVFLVLKFQMRANSAKTHGKKVFERHEPVSRKARAGLSLAALGVVYGDIGTSPLYAMRSIFTFDNHSVVPTQEGVYGILSLLLWSVMIIVSFKYVLLVMRADNDGEGGILALTALLRKTLVKTGFKIVTVLGLVGAALFFGDSMITPAMSVMSAVEGLETVYPDAQRLIVPVSLVILAFLFGIQRFGTSLVGRAFGPIMALWFLTLAALGVPHIYANPGILSALLPTYALGFVWQHPFLTFGVLGAAVLAITGAEALYADMGHFGRTPIARAWFMMVLPCLALNYLGQAALILEHPTAVDAPFFYLVPEGLRLPVIVLATLATVIASQAVISGAFSVTAQALNLGFLPRMRILHTSKSEGGQIYVPAINVLLAIGVGVLIIGFKSSDALSHAYGLAVTGTELLTTTLFFLFARHVLRWSWVRIIPMLCIILSLEISYFSANVQKIPTGGWLPILIASVFLLVMATWIWGVRAVRDRRSEIEINMRTLLKTLREKEVRRLPGQAIYLHENRGTVPIGLKENLRFNQCTHEQIVLVHVKVLNIPHVRHAQRVSVERFGRHEQKLFDITISLGFNDTIDIPYNLRLCSNPDAEFVFREDQARYFVSVLELQKSDQVPWYLMWRRSLFMFLIRNATQRVDVMRLPRSRTAIIGGSIYL